MVVTRASLATNASANRPSVATNGSTTTPSETVQRDNNFELVCNSRRASQQGNALAKLTHMVFLKQSVHKMVSRTRRKSAEKRHTSSGSGPLPSAAKPSVVPNTSLGPSHRESLVQVAQQKPHPPLEQNRRVSNTGAHEDTSRSGRRRSHLLQVNFSGGHFTGMKEPVHHHRDVHDGFRDLMAVAKAKRAGRLFLRLGGPGARVEFLKEHPFFQGTSQTLRERLAPQLVRRSVEQANSDVLRQGEQPEGSTDYLFLTSTDFNANIEVILDGNAVAVLCGGVVFGQEVVFHVTNSFLFGIRVPAEAVQFLWVIPRKTLQKLLMQDMFKDDAQLLSKRAHRNTISILRAWYLHPISHIKLRLFDNADHSFRRALVQGADMKLCASGTAVCNQGELWTDAIFVFRGEAQIKIGGVKVGRLAHTHGMNAWAAWWSILEAIGTSNTSTASIEAVTDCIVWQLSPAALEDLREIFPMECRLFDKVAVEHLKLLRNYAMRIQDSCLKGKCDQFFLKALDSRCESRIYQKGDVVIHEKDTNTDEVYIVIRGHVEVRKQCDDEENHVVVANFTEGDWFGEVAALGVRETRTATVICNTLCDIRVLTRASILEALERFPDQGTHLEKLGEQHGYAQQRLSARPDLVGLPFFSAFSLQFLERLTTEATNLSAFKLQHIIEQGHEAKGMFVLLQGRVALVMDDAQVHEIKAPGIVGDFSLVDPTAKSLFTARSQCLCHFRVITTVKAQELLQIFPEVAAKFGDLAAESLETLRSVLLRRFHGMNLSSVAKKQAAGVEESLWESEGKPAWWSETLFQASDVRFLEYLTQHINKSIFFPDEVMIQEGDEGDYALVILAGEGVVELGGMRVGEVKLGSLVGEATLIGNSSRRTATVRAVGLVSVCVLSRSVFVQALEDFPAEMERVQELMHLRRSANKILKGGAHSGGQTSQLAGGSLPFRSPASSIFAGLLSGKPAPIRGNFAQTLVDSSRETLKSSRSGSRRNSEEKERPQGRDNSPPEAKSQSEKTQTSSRRNSFVPTSEASSRRNSFAPNPDGRRVSRAAIPALSDNPDGRRVSRAAIPVLSDTSDGNRNSRTGMPALSESRRQSRIVTTIKRRRNSFLPQLASSTEGLRGPDESEDEDEVDVLPLQEEPGRSRRNSVVAAEMAPLSVIHRPRSASFMMLSMHGHDEHVDEDDESSVASPSSVTSPLSKHSLTVPGLASAQACDVSGVFSESVPGTETQYERRTLLLPQGLNFSSEAASERSSSKRSSSKDSKESSNSSSGNNTPTDEKASDLLAAANSQGMSESAASPPIPSGSVSSSPSNRSLASEPAEESKSLASEPVESAEDWRSSMIHKFEHNVDLKKGMDLRTHMDMLEPEDEYSKQPTPEESSSNADTQSRASSEFSRTTAISVVAPLAFCDSLLYAEDVSPEDEFLVEPAPKRKHRETPAEWAERRRIAIEDAPVRKAGHLIKDGSLLPLVPSSRGYTDGKIRSTGSFFADGKRQKSESRARKLLTYAMSTAPRVYLGGKRCDDQCSVVYRAARCGNA